MKHITAPIRNNETGETRLYEYDIEDQHAEGQVFWWEEGNGSCDCNRMIFFCQIKGEDDDERECGDTLFHVEYITIDGVRHKIDGPYEFNPRSGNKE